MKNRMNSLLIGVLGSALLFSLYVFSSGVERVFFHQGNSSSLVQDDASEVTTDGGEPSKTPSLYRLYTRVEDTMKLLPASESDDTYVDYYGGCYIEDNTLVVCLTDTNILNSGTVPVLQERTICVKEVTYSYNHMKEIENSILNKYEQLYSQFQTDPDSPEFLLLSSIMGTAIDEKENNLRVDILDLNAEKEAVFLKLFGAHHCAVLNNCVEALQDLVTTYDPGSGAS